MMSTVVDYNVLMERTESVSQVIQREDPEFLDAFVKILCDYIQVTNPKIDFQYLSYVMDNPALLESVLVLMVSTVSEAQKHTETYSTGDLAKFFGVSITTINNWIDAGRFLNYSRPGENKHAKIPATTQWQSPGGTVVPVWQVVADYDEQMRLMLNVSDDQEMQMIRDHVKRLETRYNGPYENTLAVMENKTVRQERDAELWRYYLSLLVPDRE